MAKRNYFNNINRKLAKRYEACYFSAPVFRCVFRDDMERKLPHFIPFLNSLDIRIDTIKELYDWAFTRPEKVLMKRIPIKGIQLIQVDEGVWHGAYIDHIDF